MISIIPSDNAVYIDGTGFGNIDLSWLPGSVRAIQWDGTSGHVEHGTQYAVTANERIADFSPYARAVELWTKAKEAAELLAEQAAQEAEQEQLALQAEREQQQKDTLRLMRLNPFFSSPEQSGGTAV